jgi:ketosteroid isomerase-like protein
VTQIWIDQLFATIDKKDTAGFLNFLSEDATFRFGNAEPIQGHALIGEAVEAFFASILTSQHSVAQIWPTATATACHGFVTYTRLDGTTVTVPFANALYHSDDGRIHEYLIHIDLTPLHQNPDLA